MGIHNKLLISVKHKWLDNDEYDEQGQLIRWANPNPTVVLYRGIWTPDPEKAGGRQHLTGDVSADAFREATGIIIYGGDIEPRGRYYISISDEGVRKLRIMHDMPTEGKRTVPERAKESRIEKIMKGEAIPKKGAQVRVRRKAK